MTSFRTSKLRVCVLALLCLAGEASAQRSQRPIAVMDLTSASGPVVNAGSAVHWRLQVRLLVPIPLGIAGVAVSVRQTAGAGPIFLEPASSVDPSMAPFRRPAGICGPGPGGVGDSFAGQAVANGFGGTDVISIGGAQNNFGVALPAVGDFATSAEVVPGIGAQGPALIAGGSCLAPRRVGAYAVALDDPRVNVFGDVGVPPMRSRVVSVQTVSESSLDFVVACFADFNSDSSVSPQDIFDFLEAFFAGSPAADYNGTDGVTVQDVFDFLEDWFIGCEF